MPANESLRLEALLDCDILDTEPEQAYDDLAQLASQICQTPIALVSLVDERRQWFKARVGLSVTQTPRHIAFCSHAIQLPDRVLLVEDTLGDQRFRENPLVTGDPGIRFYAGAPLLAPNAQPLGTVCVVDTVPRKLDAGQVSALQALARLGSTLLRKRLQRKALHEAEQAQAESEARFRCLADGAPVLVWNCGPDMKWDWVNRQVLQHTGRSLQQLVETGWKSLVHPDDSARFRREFEEAFIGHRHFQCEYRIRRHDGLYRWFVDSAVPRFRPDGKFMGYAGLLMDITEHVESETNGHVHARG